MIQGLSTNPRMKEIGGGTQVSLSMMPQHV